MRTVIIVVGGTVDRKWYWHSRVPVHLGLQVKFIKNFQLQTEKYYRNQREGDKYFLFRKSELTIAEKPAAGSICAN